MSCVAHDEGRICGRESMICEPVELCSIHSLRVALLVVPDLLRERLATVARPVSIADLLEGPHAPVVYFIAHGDRVKIGFTSGLKKRVNGLTLRPDSVLQALDGGVELERALHARFAADRVADTEWFERSSEIQGYKDDRRAEAPQPARRTAPVGPGRTAPVERASSAAEQDALLADLTVVLRDEPRMRTGEALHRLVEHAPDTYRSWTFRDLTQVLRAAGAPPRTYNGYPVVDRRAINAARDADQ